MTQTYNCPLCGEIPKSATKRHSDNLKAVYCKLCGNRVTDVGHPVEAA